MPGGIVVPLPEKFRAQVRRDFPTVPLDRLDRIASDYHSLRDDIAQSPASIRRDLHQIVKMAAELKCKLHLLTEEAYGELFDAALRAGDPSITERSVEALIRLINAAKSAVNEMELPKAGRRVGPKLVLASRLATLLSSVGVEVDKRPNGALRILTDLVLEAYGDQGAEPDKFSDTRKIVAAALERIAENPHD